MTDVNVIGLNGITWLLSKSDYQALLTDLQHSNTPNAKPNTVAYQTFVTSFAIKYHSTIKLQPSDPKVPLLNGVTSVSYKDSPKLWEYVIANYSLTQVSDFKTVSTIPASATATFNKSDKKRLQDRQATQTVPDTLAGYRWNLPPHRWSMPLYAPTITPIANTTPKGTAVKGSSITNQTAYGVERSALRRGRIRFMYANTKQQYRVNVPGGAAQLTSAQAQYDSRKFGFQFMWNPDQFSTSVALNTNTTVSLNDMFSATPGYFPGVESLTVTIRLDRTNDFACFRGRATPPSEAELYDTWYPDRMPFENIGVAAGARQKKSSIGDTYQMKVDQMLRVGTLADIEYLYRSINDSTVMSRLHNSYGDNFETADIGFLGATLVQAEFGPLSYLGFIVGIQVNHIAFTEDYIPIRTDLTVSMNMIATAQPTAGVSATTK